MRSRYSAYARRLEDYVFRTWHPRTRPDEVSLPALVAEVHHLNVGVRDRRVHPATDGERAGPCAVRERDGRWRDGDRAFDAQAWWDQSG